MQIKRSQMQNAISEFIIELTILILQIIFIPSHAQHKS